MRPAPRLLALATAVPWFILGGGLIAALIMAGVVGVLAISSLAVSLRWQRLRAPPRAKGR